MKKKKGFINKVTNGKASLPSKAQKRQSAGIAVQRRRNPMPNNEGDPIMTTEKKTPTKGATIKPTTPGTEPSSLTIGLKAVFGGSHMYNKKNMKNCLSLLLVLLSALPMVAHSQQATGAERIRVIVDTDIMNERDDQHALAYTFLNGHVFEVEGVTTNSKHQWEVEPFAYEARFITHLCASKAPVHIGAYMTYDRIKADINKSTFDGHAAVNFIIERAHASDPDGRPLYVMTFGKVTNLALALLKDPTIAPKIKAVALMTRFPASLEPSADWTVSESNSLDDRYATAALLENANLELHIVPWASRVPGGKNTLNPSFEEIYDIMPGLGPKVDPIVYNNQTEQRNAKARISIYNGQTFTCWGDFSVAIFRGLEHVIVKYYRDGNPVSHATRRDLLDVAAPMVLKNPDYAISTVMGAPRWDGTPDWTGSKNSEPGKWILNPDNPRKVTVWNRLHLKHSLVMEDYWNTMRNPSVIQPQGK